MKVKMKSAEQIEKLVKEGKLEVLGGSDSGELTRYGIKWGSATIVFSLWYQDYGSEYEVVDHPSPISKQDYEARRILFEDEEKFGLDDILDDEII